MQPVARGPQGHLEWQTIEDFGCPGRIEDFHELPILARFARKNGTLRREVFALAADSGNLNACAAGEFVPGPLTEKLGRAGFLRYLA